MSVETDQIWPTRGLIDKLRILWMNFRKLVEQLGIHLHFASLARRIVFLNVFGLLLLVSGILYLNQFREGLIDAKVSSLEVQGQIIAAAISAGTADEREGLQVNPEILLESTSGHTYSRGGVDDLLALDFIIDPTLVAPILSHLIKPTNTRARIYNKEGDLVLDSDQFFTQGEFRKSNISSDTQTPINFVTRFSQQLKVWYRRNDLPIYEDIGSENGKAYIEVVSALNGTATPTVRVNKKGELVVSIGVPINQNGQIPGVLLLSTRGGEIDSILSKERMAIGRVSLFALAITGLLSMILAGTIAGPMQRLSSAAIRVRKSIKAREEIPDFTDRSDEIGNLSGALREMTNALYARIEAIENFAADVSHELKNPLTSLRSAAETLPLAKTEKDKSRLIQVILHDVRRLDRLISDISDASRLDAELVREEAVPVDMVRLTNTVIEIVNGTHLESEKNVKVRFRPTDLEAHNYLVNGHESRLGQVMNNLLDNAISFSPEESEVVVTLSRSHHEIELSIEDSGPGIPPENLEKVFTRFYTDRPGEEAFGKNSGLGLNISRQIILAHGGRIWAENLPLKYTEPSTNNEKDMADSDEQSSAAQVHGGARFVIVLPTI